VEIDTTLDFSRATILWMHEQQIKENTPENPPYPFKQSRP
jgi:hypothetical protein